MTPTSRSAGVPGDATPGAGQPAALGRAASGDVVACARSLVERGLATGSVGNVSQRDHGVILITPTRVPHARLTAEELVAVDLDGSVLGGHGTPSTELALHLALYRFSPSIGAVVHSHGPWTTAWSFLDEPLRPETEDIAYYDIGHVRTAAWAPAGSSALGDAAVAALADSRAVLLARHGTVAVGTTPDEALTIAQVVEYQAQVAWLLRPDAPRGGT